MSVERPADSQPEHQGCEGIWNGGWPQTREEFEALAASVLDRLVRYAFRLLRSVDDAEDVIQDVLVRVYADRAKRKNVELVVPYLYRMVANACKERQRRDRRRPAAIKSVRLEEIPDEQDDTQAHLDTVSGLRWIEELLSQLPPKQAEVIRLRVIDDLSLSDIALIVHCSLPTAKSRLCYGLRKLRQIVPYAKDRGDGKCSAFSEEEDNR